MVNLVISKKPSKRFGFLSEFRFKDGNYSYYSTKRGITFKLNKSKWKKGFNNKDKYFTVHFGIDELFLIINQIKITEKRLKKDG